MQDAGLIRSQDFDTVFMGTSLAIHFRQSDIDRMLGVKSLKLALNGSNSREQSFVLAAALERRPKRVLWEVDDWIFRDAPDIDSNIYLPADLYRRNARGVAGYLLSGSMARESAWIMARSIPPLEPVVARLTSDALFKFPVSRVDDINVLQPDFDLAAAYNAKKAHRRLQVHHGSGSQQISGGRYDYDMKVRVFERDAVGLIAGKSGRAVRHLPAALFDPAMGGDARCFAGDAEDRLRFFRLFLPAAGGISECPPL